MYKFILKLNKIQEINSNKKNNLKQQLRKTKPGSINNLTTLPKTQNQHIYKTKKLCDLQKLT